MTRIVTVEDALSKRRDLVKHFALPRFRLEDLVKGKVGDLLPLSSSRRLGPARHSELTLSIFGVRTLVAVDKVRNPVG